VGGVLRGYAVSHVDYSGVKGVGYTEKRAGADGMHASDIYLGGRIINMQGLVYGSSLAELFDFLHALRSTLSPTSAYQQSPADKGFLPLVYSQPTLDVTSFPGGVVPLYLNARPSDNVHFSVADDRQVRANGKGPSALPWSSLLLAKDPRVYISPGKVVDVSGAAAGPVAGSAVNRGDYETPLSIQLVIGSTAPGAGTFRVTGFNGIDMTITIENKPNVIYRWFGDDRVLMTEDVSAGLGTSGLALRMDLVTFATKQRRPAVPASINPPSRPFTTAFTYWKTVALAGPVGNLPGSNLFWSEAFA
jgi:hypothetical protein